MDKELSNVLAEIRSSGINHWQGEIVTCDCELSGSDLKGNYIYQVYLPPEIKTGAEELPLIIFLHGIRERGTGGYISSMFAALAQQYLKTIPAVVLFPQCRPGKYWSDEEMDRMVIAQYHDVRTELAIDTKRQYLVGVSMGGYGVWSIAIRHKIFAALVSICGGSPFRDANRFTEVAERIGKIPVRLFHGAEDRVVPVSESRGLVAAFEANQGNVKYSEYPQVGHNVWLNAIGEKELIPWLLSQKLD